MAGKIGRWGNSAAVRIPRDVLERAGLREGQAVELVVNGTEVAIRPAVRTPRYTLDELVAEMERIPPEDRPPLVDWGILPTEWPDEDWSDVAPTDDDAEDTGR
jgi:antitoxin MazE